jgi:hypothetical protein
VSDDNNPFGSLEPDLKERIQERMPQKITPKKAMYTALGLGIMVFGGLFIAFGSLIGFFTGGGRGIVFFSVLIGGGICSGGYYFWQQAQKRERPPRKDESPG